MPKRMQYAREDSTERSSTTSESEIPWFTNFGKFVNNTEFFKCGTGNRSHQLHQTNSYQLVNDSNTKSQTELQNAFKFSSVPSESKPSARAPNGIRETNMPVARFRRASSEVVHSAQNSHSGPPNSRETRAFRVSRDSEEEEEAPKTLGAMLRRMVSFDQYPRRNMNREQPNLIPVYDGISVTDDAPISIAPRDANRLQVDQSRMLPPTVPLGTNESVLMAQPQTMQFSRNAPMDRSLAGQVHTVDFRRRHPASDGDAPKTLGAMFRRMVSFDQPSKRTESQVHEDSKPRKGGRVHQRISIQLPRRANGH